MNADPVSAFLSAMEAVGIKPIEPIASMLGPKLCRFRCEGDGKGKRNGWAILYTDGKPAGAFGNYRMQIRERWRLEGGCDLSPADLDNWKREVRQRQVQREGERIMAQRRAASECQQRWVKAAKASPTHPYLVAKRIGPEGLKQEGRALLVPMRDEHGVLWNLQRIFPDGFKQFTPEARVDGLYWPCGRVDDRLAIGEGMASMAAVRRASGLPVAAAFTAGNLRAVAKVLRRKFPEAEIILAADDDRALLDHPQVQKNVGVAAAVDAARSIGGVVALPPRGGEKVHG